MIVLVTGATGFVGESVVSSLTDHGHEVVAVSRGSQVAGAAETRLCHDLARGDLGALVDGVDVVVHLAGIAHRHGVGSGVHDEANRIATEHLGRAAVAAGVRRFVFMSTSKVHGEATVAPIDANAPLEPCDSYSESKVSAEAALRRLCDEHADLAVTVLRPPVVYDRGARANIGAISAMASNGLPIPMLLPEPRRSMISRPHLASIVSRCAEFDQVGFRPFVVADRRSVTLSELARAASTRRPLLVPVPAAAARVVARIPALRRFAAVTTSFELDPTPWERASGLRACEPDLQLLRRTG